MWLETPVPEASQSLYILVLSNLCLVRLCGILRKIKLAISFARFRIIDYFIDIPMVETPELAAGPLRSEIVHSCALWSS